MSKYFFVISIYINVIHICYFPLLFLWKHLDIITRIICIMFLKWKASGRVCCASRHVMGHSLWDSHMSITHQTLLYFPLSFSYKVHILMFSYIISDLCTHLQVCFTFKQTFSHIDQTKMMQYRACEVCYSLRAVKLHYTTYICKAKCIRVCLVLGFCHYKRQTEILTLFMILVSWQKKRENLCI